MPVVRFVREGRDVECYPGENLREVALREGIQLYGLKGQLGNCGGCGQCITCFVEVKGDDAAANALTGRTAVEEAKLRRRPDSWRLACQALVERSVVILTRPQVSMGDQRRRIEAALSAPLPLGPTAWPVVDSADDDEDGDGEVEPNQSSPDAPATPDDEA